MAKVSAYNTYGNTGWPAPCRVSRATGGGYMVAPKGAGKHLMVLGIITEGPMELKATPDGTDSGTVILSLLPGDTDNSAQFNFPGAVDMGDNKGIYGSMSTAETNLTIFYYIHDANIN